MTCRFTRAITAASRREGGRASHADIAARSATIAPARTAQSSTTTVSFMPPWPVPQK